MCKEVLTTYLVHVGLLAGDRARLNSLPLGRLHYPTTKELML